LFAVFGKRWPPHLTAIRPMYTVKFVVPGGFFDTCTGLSRQAIDVGQGLTRGVCLLDGSRTLVRDPKFRPNPPTMNRCAQGDMSRMLSGSAADSMVVC